MVTFRVRARFRVSVRIKVGVRVRVLDRVRLVIKPLPLSSEMCVKGIRWDFG